MSCRVFCLTGLLFVTPPASVDDSAGLQAKVARFELDPTFDEFLTVSARKRHEQHLNASGYTRLQKLVLVAVGTLATAAASAIPVALAVPLAGKRRPEEPKNEEGGTNQEPEPQPQSQPEL